MAITKLNLNGITYDIGGATDSDSSTSTWGPIIEAVEKNSNDIQSLQQSVTDLYEIVSKNIDNTSTLNQSVSNLVETISHNNNNNNNT